MSAVVETAEARGVKMPRYRCYKEVNALCISRAAPRVGGGAVLFFQDAAYGAVVVKPSVVSRYFPQPGDYYVVYGDGYESISPAKPFEEGYERIE